MKKIIFFFCAIAVVAISHGRPSKVFLTYNVEEVSIIYSDLVFNESPKDIVIDFELGGSLIFYRSGYESLFVKLSKENAFQSYNVVLIPLQNKVPSTGIDIELKKVSFINYVTNFTPAEVTEIIKQRFIASKVSAHTENTVFQSANVTDKNYTIGVEVLKSNSKNGSYTAPYFLFSYQKLRWSVLDNVSNNLILEHETEGLNLVTFKARRGLIASDRLKEITIFAIEEATQKFINSPEFASLFKSK